MATNPYDASPGEGSSSARQPPALMQADPGVGPCALAGAVSEVGFWARLRERDRGWVLELTGECDMAVADALDRALAAATTAALDCGKALVIDVHGLSFCDAQCTGLILKTARNVRVVLAGAEGSVKRVFDLLDPSHDLARTAFRRRTPGTQTPSPARTPGRS
jgi:anti-anti-sigma factor